MQQIVYSKNLADDLSRVSAFHPVVNSTEPKSPRTPVRREKDKRDSGYGSDFSPATTKTARKIFTFEDTDDVGMGADKLCDLSELDIRGHSDDEEDEDVFVGDAVPDFGQGFSVIPEVEEHEETDIEVEELLSKSPLRHRTSHPACERPRPSAPLPTPENADVDLDVSSRYIGSKTDSSPSVENPVMLISRCCTREWLFTHNRFRPIISRSVGTQTLNSQLQQVRDATSMDAMPQRHILRGELRLRMPSDASSRDLPDVVPMSRDRSISLPDVGSYARRQQEQHVGRELRRISDAFNSTYEKKFAQDGRRRVQSESEQTPLLRGRIISSIRRIVSSSTLFQWAGEEDGR